MLDVTAMLLVTLLTCLDQVLVMVATGTVMLTLSITNGEYINYNHAWYLCNWYCVCFWGGVECESELNCVKLKTLKLVPTATMSST